MSHDEEWIPGNKSELISAIKHEWDLLMDVAGKKTAPDAGGWSPKDNLTHLAELVKKLNAMSFEDLLAPRHADDPQKRPVLLWVPGDTTEHFSEHRATIEKML
jgi:hypothetical protein